MQLAAIQLPVITVIGGIDRVIFGRGSSYRWRPKLQVRSGREIGVENERGWRPYSISRLQFGDVENKFRSLESVGCSYNLPAVQLPVN